MSIEPVVTQCKPRCVPVILPLEDHELRNILGSQELFKKQIKNITNTHGAEIEPSNCHMVIIEGRRAFLHLAIRWTFLTLGEWRVSLTNIMSCHSVRRWTLSAPKGYLGANSGSI